jgi:hypothetical protein
MPAQRDRCQRSAKLAFGDLEVEDDLRAENRLDAHAYQCVVVTARNRQNYCVHQSLLRPVATRREVKTKVAPNRSAVVESPKWQRWPSPAASSARAPSGVLTSTHHSSQTRHSIVAWKVLRLGFCFRAVIRANIRRVRRLQKRDQGCTRTERFPCLCFLACRFRRIPARYSDLMPAGIPI